MQPVKLLQKDEEIVEHIPRRCLVCKRECATPPYCCECLTIWGVLQDHNVYAERWRHYLRGNCMVAHDGSKNNPGCLCFNCSDDKQNHGVMKMLNEK